MKQAGSTGTSMLFGKHYLFEISNCKAESIAEVTSVEQALLTAVEVSGAGYIAHNAHQFSPHGVTAVVLLKESHIAIHTWPEKKYAAVDFFTCSEKLNMEAVVSVLKNHLGSESIEIKIIDRGIT